MWKELLAKWFGLDISCSTCEVLKEQLSIERQFNQVLLARVLDGNKPESPPAVLEEYKPIKPQFVPWRMRQQMLEAEDRKAAELMKKRANEISELEKELGVAEKE